MFSFFSRSCLCFSIKSYSIFDKVIADEHKYRLFFCHVPCVYPMSSSWSTWINAMLFLSPLPHLKETPFSESLSFFRFSWCCLNIIIEFPLFVSISPYYFLLLFFLSFFSTPVCPLLTLSLLFYFVLSPPLPCHPAVRLNSSHAPHCSFVFSFSIPQRTFRVSYSFLSQLDSHHISYPEFSNPLVPLFHTFFFFYFYMLAAYLSFVLMCVAFNKSIS